MDNLRELRARRAEYLDLAEALHTLAEKEDRNLTGDEQEQFDDYVAKADEVEERIKRGEKMKAILEERKPPAHNKIGRGDTEARAVAHFVRTGDGGGLGEFRASNDTDMNVGTNADGGFAVPTGHYNGIVARRDEGMITTRLGVRPIPGTGTTVNVPVDNEADGEFVSTSEGVDLDRDAPALDQKAMTLVRYTKKIQLSWELLEDEDSRLLAFLEDFVGRGMAKTHNNLLLTEVAANGTSLKTFASATAIAVDELEPIVFDNNLSFYLEDMGSVAWVMQPAVHGEIVLLDDANVRRYASNTIMDSSNGGFQPTLLGYPIIYSNKSGATEASAKSVYFGNWNFVGWREAGIFTFLRDPYSYEAGIELRYQFRTDYAVLQAEAIGYGEHPSA